MDDVRTALEFAVSGCLDGKWMAGRGMWGDAVRELNEAKEFIDEALDAIQAIRDHDNEEKW